MKCKITTCYNHKDCGILDITNKIPQNASSCSYYKTQNQIEKKMKKQFKHQQDIEKLKKSKSRNK